MQQYLIPKDIESKLREAGFNEPYIEGLNSYIHEQVMKWLWKEHKIFFSSHYHKDDKIGLQYYVKMVKELEDGRLRTVVEYGASLVFGVTGCFLHLVERSLYFCFVSDFCNKIIPAVGPSWYDDYYDNGQATIDYDKCAARFNKK